MTGWQDSVPAPEPLPLDEEEADNDRIASAKAKLFHDLLQQLLRENAAGYIVFQELTIDSGRSDELIPVKRWGFYTMLAERWDCAPNTIKNWFTAAMRFIAKAGQEAIERRRGGFTDEIES